MRRECGCGQNTRRQVQVWTTKVCMGAKCIAEWIWTWMRSKHFFSWRCGFFSKNSTNIYMRSNSFFTYVHLPDGGWSLWFNRLTHIILKSWTERMERTIVADISIWSFMKHEVDCFSVCKVLGISSLVLMGTFFSPSLHPWLVVICLKLYSRHVGLFLIVAALCRKVWDILFLLQLGNYSRTTSSSVGNAK